MADIQPEIDDFQDAVYGEEVRGALISLAEKLNTEMETATDKVDAHDESIAVAIEDAETATSAANAAAAAANASAATCDTATGDANAAAAAAASAANTASATNANVTAAEAARVTAEQGRVSAETARVTAEQSRAAAEQLRAQSETSRTSFENTRQENEQLRQSAEAARVTAEAERQGAESGRVSAEGLRVQAEAGRVTAENNRANAFAQMQQQILPPANNVTLGGVIIGEGINYDSNGKISIPSGVYETEQHAAETYATKTEMSGKANATHVHTATDITSGTLAVARGGTGAATAADARTALSLYSKSEIDDVLDPLLAAMANAKALLGQLGLDGNDDPLIDAATARANLDAAQSNGASGTLRAAEGEIDALESSLAYVESTTAKTNHAVGDYFMLGNVLMKATAAIAAGETINASKATPATVQSQIDTLRDSVYPQLTTSTWINVIHVNAQMPQCFLPCMQRPTTVAVSNAEVYVSGSGWTSVTFSNWSWAGNFLILHFVENEDVMPLNYSKLIRMNLVVS